MSDTFIYPSLQSQLQERESQNIEVEQEQQEETRRLKQQLEESRRENSRLGLERDEVARNLEERERDRDALRKENAQLDDQHRQQERALDKLNKEVCITVKKEQFSLQYFSSSHFFSLSFRWSACLQPPVRRCGSYRLSWTSRERSGGRNSKTLRKAQRRS